MDEKPEFKVITEDGDEYDVEYLFDHLGSETLDPSRAQEFKEYGNEELIPIVYGDRIIGSWQF